MCDTFVALPDATVDGSVIFGKNSDRPAGESQISKLSAQQGEHWLIDRPFPCQQNYKLIAFSTTIERKHQPMAVNP